MAEKRCRSKIKASNKKKREELLNHGSPAVDDVYARWLRGEPVFASEIGIKFDQSHPYFAGRKF